MISSLGTTHLTIW